MFKSSIIYALITIGVGMLFTHCTRSYETIIAGGTIVDGTGAKPYKADIGIRDGKIATIGKLKPSSGVGIIDASGKYVVPGFIDMHNHSDVDICDEKRKNALNYLTQGVTTLVTGNCGMGTFDVAELYATIEQQGAGTNIVHLVGHATVRQAVMGEADREPTYEELEKMKALVEKAMREGAAGLSTGLFYAPGSYAKTEEIIELCKIVKQHSGFYATHVRDESDYTIGLKAAIEEAIAIGEKAGVPVQISHIKALGKPVWGQAAEVSTIIEAARNRGLKVYTDRYPYNASSTWLSAAVLPRWIQTDGKMRERLKDPKLLPEIKKEIAANIERRGGPETLLISFCPESPDLIGQSLKEIGTRTGKTAVDVAVELLLVADPSVISFNMSEADVIFFMKQPYAMTSSDGEIPSFGQGLPHPRNYGAFTRNISKYVFDEKIVSIEHAIRAASGLPAEMLGFPDRGLLKEGYVADIVVFTPDKLRDMATFTNPHQYSQGIDYVLISGKKVIHGAKYTGVLAGKPIKRQ